MNSEAFGHSAAAGLSFPERGSEPIFETSEQFQELMDSPGGLTIVLQGSVYDWNLVSTATRCKHWRDSFPAAEIVLSIALTDILVPNDSDELELAPLHANNGEFRKAVVVIKQVCDNLVLSTGDLPLPPIKFDNKPNNINLQIVAAKSGMRVASGLYVLRIRSDITLFGRGWLDFYFRNFNLPRRERTAFRQRIMISPMFTINPLTLERMPFHFSDWFHFGLRSDVSEIWELEPYSFADACFYERTRHDVASNAEERAFRSRLAAEQYINFNALSKRIPDLTLRYHNDRTCAVESLRVLLNEFIVCDQIECGFSLDKYASFNKHHLSILCVNFDEWRRLVLAGESVDFYAFFDAKIRSARWFLLLEREPLMRPVRSLLRAYGSIKRLTVSVLRVLRALAGKPASLR